MVNFLAANESKTWKTNSGNMEKAGLNSKNLHK